MKIPKNLNFCNIIRKNKSIIRGNETNSSHQNFADPEVCETFNRLLPQKFQPHHVPSIETDFTEFIPGTAESFIQNSLSLSKEDELQYLFNCLAFKHNLSNSCIEDLLKFCDFYKHQDTNKPIVFRNKDSSINEFYFCNCFKILPSTKDSCTKCLKTACNFFL